MSNVILATASYDRTIKFWSYSDQKIIHQFEYCSQKQTSFVNKIEVSHDKQYLGTAGSATINLYDLNDKYKLKHVYDGYKSNVTSVGFKQNNGWIYASSEDGSIKVHDLAMQGVQKTFNSKEPVNQVVLHPNEVELISADQAGNVKIWDLRKEQTYVKKIALSPEIGIRSVSICANAQFYSAVDSSGQLFIQKLSKIDDPQSLQKIEKAHDDYILKCQISPLATSLATCSADKTIKIWGINTSSQKFELKQTLYGHTKWVWDISYGCDGEFLFSCSSDKFAKLWKLDDETQQVSCINFKHDGIVNCLAFNDINI
ncbi:required for amino acid permease transport from the to the cell surface protein (macronuclear) [Tetrahymena thermophila SB210]|uniref:Required for amino acid permease transport from the to the cell surface protein n=1 Tax=Tetrahymena thermophila (strain SB210) TaxID=312017 RepID=W7X6G8_TETTS|nr:required for amino acid permease transport from the to the cell surface protein [Tetrahymena thermophila SB210]EWS73007.1 required for amino acid permease transport from the to the cell surface protein [Tetrahymena thermophila SB210]|eukprot:XP_012654404.1 required for amino acid permease transport from the to the cell surface protein [Tetrahymena thermophila SB210]